MYRRKTTLRVAILTCLVALVVSACGGSSVDSATTTAAGDPATSPPDGSAPDSTTSTASTLPESAGVRTEDLLGSWGLSSGYEITFLQSGRWEVAEPESTEDPFDWGTYTVADSMLTLTTAEGVTSGCPAGSRGEYELAVSDDGETLETTPIGDDCATRSSDFERGLMRLSG